MHLGLIVSLLFHAGLLAWAVLTIHKTEPLKTPELQPVEVAIVSADDLVRLTKGDRSSKNLEASGKDGAAKEPPKKEVKTPPPPPPPAAAPPPPPAPEQPKPDEIAALMKNEPPPPPPEKKAEPPPPAKQPDPPPGPTPDEQALLQKKLDDDARKAEEAKAKAKAEADAKREQDRLKKLADDKKRRDDLAKKQAADKKKREDEEKKKSFANVENVLKGIPDDGPQKALVSQQVKPAQPAGAPGTATAKKGPQAGAPEGKDTKLTASEASMLIGMITGKVKQCWNINAGMDGAEQLVPKVEFELNRDGTLRGMPKVINSAPSPQFQAAAASAMRAIVQCQPYTGLPPERYENWEIVRLTFDPSQMFR